MPTPNASLFSTVKIINGRFNRPGALLVSSLMFVLATAGVLEAQEQRDKLQREAQPSSVDILAFPANKSTGQLPVKVVLLDRDGKPTKATENTSIKIQSSTTGPQKTEQQKTEQTVQVPKGQDSINTIVTQQPNGPVKLKATDPNEQLIGSTSYAPSPTDQSLVPNPAKLSLLLEVSGENDGGAVRADGENFARVQILAMSGNPPSTKVRVWLSPSKGYLLQNPMTIREGTTSADTRWVSQEVGPATIKILRTDPPNIDFVIPHGEATFVQPIYKLKILQPPGRISIVEAPTITVQLRDRGDRPISTDVPRWVRLVSSNPDMHLDPGDVEIKVNQPDNTTTLLPSFYGQTIIEASTAGFPVETCTVQVLAMGALLLSIAGAALGGLLAYITHRSSFWAHMISGLILGMVASWAYVMVGLPHADTNLLHNHIAVFFVSLLAAFAGVKILEPIMRGIGFSF